MNTEAYLAPTIAYGFASVALVMAMIWGSVFEVMVAVSPLAYHFLRNKYRLQVEEKEKPTNA